MSFLPVFQREMAMLVHRIGGLGYLFSGLLFPMIYLLAFGWGLGSRVEVAGGYIAYLAKGMLAIAVMMNGFQQTAISVSAARFYFRTFSVLRMSPVSDFGIVFGIARSRAPCARSSRARRYSLRRGSSSTCSSSPCLGFWESCSRHFALRRLASRSGFRYADRNSFR